MGWKLIDERRPIQRALACVQGESTSEAGASLDEVADACLLAGLSTLTDKELPIMTSDFYTKHMLPAKPPGKYLII